MSTLDLLLGIDPVKLKRPVRQVELSRLSEATGSKVVFTIQALTLNEEEEISEISDKGDDKDPVAVRIFTVLKGVVTPDLKNSKLLERYGAATPKELLESGRLLQSGEIAHLYNQISQLSGYSENAVTELKNG
ncbi:MAG: hypothetical protein K0R57_2088 [Paenibacillaceae bacterium]|jgi:hypothetical protein|nr:hypothetical protein [Paenibacillaceae bacterium]